MAQDIPQTFRLFLTRLAPTAPDDEARLRHRRTIQQALASEFASVSKVQVIGSHTRDSAIHLHSDVDYLAVLSKADATWGGSLVSSTTILKRMRAALDGRFPNTAVRIDGPAVVVAFGQGEGAVDVVPAIWAGTVSEHSGYPRYKIPDSQGGWIETSPDYHGMYIKTANKKAGGKIATTMRLLKAWKFARQPAIPCLGFHLELLLASEGTCNGVRTYGGLLIDAFRLVRDRAGRGINDPKRVSPRIDIVRSETARKSLVGAATYAADHAERAVRAETEFKLDEAARQWGLVFNGQFPSRA